LVITKSHDDEFGVWGMDRKEVFPDWGKCAIFEITINRFYDYYVLSIDNLFRILSKNIVVTFEI